MTESYKTSFDYVLGCDPGPEHCAFALVKTTPSPSLVDCAYVPNEVICRSHGRDFLAALDRHSGRGAIREALMNRGGVLFAFEKCAVQAGGANAMVFETCMMAGELRREARAQLWDACAFSPSDWRYIVAGRGNANDTIIRNILLTLLPECDTITRSCSTGIKKMLKLRKPITSHLRDAVGVALSEGYCQYRSGSDWKRFPARLEVHCG